ncbi:fibronectin type III domain-containing protein [Nocardioides panacisoli]|uniref:Fibronectin type-III domain-containing protein n=1 Tax=Nocardioides panacisoli TaxID=627624 RepID=A0ABP7I489_9ACTN
MPPRRFLTRMVIAWLPVACLLGLAFVAASPGSSETRLAGHLSISPTNFYGGQAVTFSGDIGRSGKHKIWLEFNMNRPGDGWTKIDGSNHYTDASGHFNFQFPARGMLNISVRVATQGSATDGVKFQAVDQAVSIAVQPAGDLYNLGACSASFAPFKSYEAVASEPFQVKVDATPDGEPALKGRKVTLQQRTPSDSWTNVATSTLDGDGKAAFPITLPTTGQTVYRAVLGSVTSGVNKIGWFPSFPTAVDPLHRPAKPLLANVNNPAGLDPTVLDAVAVAPADPTADKFIVAWNQGAPPTSPENADGSDTVGLGGTAHVSGLVPDQDYGFSVFTKSVDGICSTAAATATGHTDPTPPVTNVHTTDVGFDHVSLAWDLPNIPDGLIDDIKVRRADGGTPPTSPAGGVGFDFPPFPNDTSFTDFSVAASSTYSYSVFVKVNGVWSVAASVPSVTTGAQP